MTTQEVKRKLTAILSADVKGYSRLMGEDEKWTVRTLNVYREVMANLIRHHHGRVVDATGDNLMAEFASVVDAVECAVESQKELKTRNAELPENRRMEFRIGINLGDVIEEDGRIYGDGVNIAARLESLSDGGGICISGTAYDQVENKLPLGYEYLGEQTVKNIAKPVRAYRVLMELGAAGKVIGERKTQLRQWQRATIGLVGVVIVVIAAILIWKVYTPSAPQPEVVSKEKITALPLEKAPAAMTPSTEVAPKEKLVPPSPERVSKPMPPPAPKMEIASPKKMAFPLPDKPSIAVLPFVNMSDDPKQDFFADGLTEDIITALSKLPKLFVIARNSTFTYKGKAVKVQQVAEDLGVRYVLEGSVQRAGDRVRITAQLIDALKGHLIWSERYDREMKDIFALQDKITLETLKALDVKLSLGDRGRIMGKGTDNLEAYIKFREAGELTKERNRDSNVRARPLAEEVIRLDPKYPSAYYVLAVIKMMDVVLGISKSPRESLMQAIELGQKATALDDSHAPAHALLGLLYVQAREHEKGVAEAERAVEMVPHSSDAHSWLAQVLNYSGGPQEAIVHNEKAFRLDPVEPPSWYYAHAAHTYRLIGRYEDSVKMSKKLLFRSPKDIGGHLGLIMAYAALGRDGEARAATQDFLLIDPKFSAERYARSLPYKDPAQALQALELMRKAGLPD